MRVYMVEHINDELFTKMKTNASRYLARSMEQGNLLTRESKIVTDKPSLNWPILKTDIEGLSAAQLTVVLNLIHEMRKANKEDKTGSA